MGKKGCHGADEVVKIYERYVLRYPREHTTKGMKGRNREEKSEVKG